MINNERELVCCFMFCFVFDFDLSKHHNFSQCVVVEVKQKFLCRAQGTMACAVAVDSPVRPPRDCINVKLFITSYSDEFFAERDMLRKDVGF